MANIHVLKPEISNKIAAGEVVERPASVVKELVENSIDAGATQITVEIKNGGVSLISVTDNGCGMSAEDAQLAFLRHATSKIQKEEDLDAIYTLGFRGEALSSIGAVSESAIYTKRRDDEFGTVVTCEGGEIISSDDGGMSDGTKIVVRNLFYNTPARMKFLKKDSTEAGYVSDVMTRLVLAHPEISFRFIRNGKEVITSSGDGVLKNAIYAVYGRDYANNIINVEYEFEGVKVTGAIGNSFLARPNRNFQSFFINKRCIKSPMLMRAVEEAYKNQIMIGKFPVVILNVEINPSLIDINVHPTKLEVKFSDEKTVYDAVYFAAKSALYAIPETKTADALHNPRVNPFLLKEDKQPEKENTPQKPEVKPVVTIKNNPIEAYIKKTDSKPQTVFASPAVEVRIPETPPKTPETEASTPEIKQIEISDTAPKTTVYIPEFKVLAQVFDTYIIAQKENEMLLVDQHAAHERIKYEQLLKSVENKQCYPQILLEPVVVKLGGEEFAAFEANSGMISDLGFEAEIFGENELIVRAAPQDVEWSDVEDLIIELLSELASAKKEVISAKLQRMTYTIACKAAVKANRVLNKDEMEGLLKAVFALDNINTCPHGRPITVTISKKDLEKMFKRIV